MNEKIVVITGASSGIGLALAKQLGSRGYNLVLAARRGRELKRLADQTSTTAFPVVTDVTRREDVDRLRDLALREFGHVDVWVNNAGRGINRTVMELTEQDLEEMLSVNLKSVFYGMQAIIPHFQERGAGHLINVSSFLGRVPWATYRSAYSAAKSAVNTLTASLRMELKRKYPGIHISLIMPGIVDTDFQIVAGTPLTSRAGTRSGPFTIQSAEEIASHIASLIEHPVPELYTNQVLAELARCYYADVGAFENEMESIFR